MAGINRTASDMDSAAVEVMRFCEARGVGKVGIDLFAHDFPNDERTKNVACVVFIDSSQGRVNRLLSGAITSQREYVTITSRAASEQKSRELLFPIVREVEKMVRTAFGTSYYMTVMSLCPIHYKGKDKNDKEMSEVDFLILRRPKQPGS